MPYCDETLLLVAWLTIDVPAARTLTDLPADLADVIPVIQVTRFGGTDSTLTMDSAAVDVEVYADAFDAAKALAETVRWSLRVKLPGQMIAGGTVAAVSTISAPTRRPTADPGVRRPGAGQGLFRVGASYRVTIHSH